jgi:hypothetical protein
VAAGRLPPKEKIGASTGAKQAGRACTTTAKSSTRIRTFAVLHQYQTNHCDGRQNLQRQNNRHQNVHGNSTE